jgi:hypothetical protein
MFSDDAKPKHFFCHEVRSFKLFICRKKTLLAANQLPLASTAAQPALWSMA